jgi:hypothetical protein
MPGPRSPRNRWHSPRHRDVTYQTWTPPAPGAVGTVMATSTSLLPQRRLAERERWRRPSGNAVHLVRLPAGRRRAPRPRTSARPSASPGRAQANSPGRGLRGRARRRLRHAPGSRRAPQLARRRPARPPRGASPCSGSRSIGPWTSHRPRRASSARSRSASARAARLGSAGRRGRPSPHPENQMSWRVR